MAESVVVGGVTYTIPDPGDNPNWATGLTPYLVAIAANIASNPTFIQYVAVAATPTTAVSGKCYLITTASLAITMNLPAPVQNAWFMFKDVSNNAASNNITLHRNGSEQIDGASSDKALARSGGTWIVMSDGTNWWTINPYVHSGTDAGLVSADISSSAAIPYSKLTLTNSIVNADIVAAAAIAVSKLAALTVSRAVATDASGFLTVATTTAAELAFVAGVTSAIQTQLNLKAPLASPTFTGNPLFPDGLVGTPGIAFSADPNTGIYRIGADDFALVAGGATTLELTTAQTLHKISNTVATPDISWVGDNDTGFYRAAANYIAFVSNGVEMGNVATGGVALKGTNTNDSAGVGYIGEYIESVVSGVSYTSGTRTNIASITLTAGDWDIMGQIVGQGGSTSTNGPNTVTISATSGSTSPDETVGDNSMYYAGPPGGTSAGTSVYWRRTIAGSTTYYVKINSTFVGGTPTAWGKIAARRRR